MILRPQTIALLRAIVAPGGEQSSEKISDAASEITDWNEVFVTARRHSVVPILYSRLAQSAHPPANALQALRPEFERNAFQCMANVAELQKLLFQFEHAGIRALPFKGVVLGASAYGDVTERNAGDIDLLIDQSDLHRAMQILLKTGYTLITQVREDGTPESEHYYEYHFERETDGRITELRWRLELTQPRFRKILDLDWAWPHRENLILAGFNVPSLDPIRALLVLCMHGSKHRWSRLMWVCDIARFLESQPELHWDAVLKEAKRTRLLRPLALGVMLAKRIADSEVPESVSTQLQAVGSMKILADHFSEHLIEAPGQIPSGRVPYGIQILDKRDLVRAVVSKDFLKPNDNDRAFVKLPKPLEALYFVLRPIRMLLDRSAR